MSWVGRGMHGIIRFKDNSTRVTTLSIKNGIMIKGYKWVTVGHCHQEINK
jgi:hypothetical protein